MTTIDPGTTLSIHGGIAVPQALVVSGSGMGGAGALVNTDSNVNGFSGAVELAGATQITASRRRPGLLWADYRFLLLNQDRLRLAWPVGRKQFQRFDRRQRHALDPVNEQSGLRRPLGLGNVGHRAWGRAAAAPPSTTRAWATRAAGGFSIATGATAVFQVDDPGVTLNLTGPISGSGSFVMSGFGQLTINGTASYTGSTTVTQGILAIGRERLAAQYVGHHRLAGRAFAAYQQRRRTSCPASGNVSLQAAAIQFFGNASLPGGDSGGTLQLGAGENDIYLSLATTGSYTPYLRFATTPASHTIGASLVFSVGGGQVQFQSNPAGLVNGILGGYAFYNGATTTDFATLSGGTVTAYSGYTIGNLGGLAASSTMNVEPTGLQTSVTSAMTINSLNLNGTSGVQMTGSGALTLGSGGLIANTTGGIRGGILKGSASGELTIYAAQDINISSDVANNGGPTALVISGPGTVTLSGSAGIYRRYLPQ